jgi:predicted XRE-type DNA-binding protein
MRIRRKLFDLILEIALRDQLTDNQLANCLRTSRTRASTLLHGHIERFNSETLIDILARLGVDIDVCVFRRRPYLRTNVRNPRSGWKPLPGFAYDRSLGPEGRGG